MRLFRLWLLVSGVCLATTSVVAAQGYVPLVGLPGVDPNTLSTTDYFNALYWFSISVAGFLAVGQIIIAGVKYMLTDVVTTKGEAKKNIKAALFGLAIVLGAVLILETINPQLTNFAALDNVPPLRASNEGEFEVIDNSQPGNPDPLAIDRDDTLSDEIAEEIAAQEGETLLYSEDINSTVVSGNPRDNDFRKRCSDDEGRYHRQILSGSNGITRLSCFTK